jgi:hypothetical protein
MKVRMAKIHDKFVIELSEVIMGYANDPKVKDPFNFPRDYKFYEIDGIAFSEDTFRKMKHLNDYMEWVPCSEREPEKTDEYLITWQGNIGDSTVRALEIAEYSFDFAKSEWDVYEIEKRGYRNVEVLAWKELPSVWEGNDEK